MIAQQKLLNPLKYVVQNSSFVSINYQAIEKFIANFDYPV